MLLRLGKIVYLCIFALIVFVWIGTHDDGTRKVVHKGWDMTAHAFSQGSSFAVDEAAASDSEKARPDVDKGIDKVQKQETQSIEALSPYAYVFYATQDTYACSVLVNIRQLQHIHKTPYRIFVLITQDISPDYVSVLSSTGAILSLQTPPALKEESEGAVYYQSCLLKLYGFKMHHIEPSLRRVIVLDSDQLILKSLDHLFHMDNLNVDLAAPRAYWIAKETFSTAFMVISLSNRVWRKVEQALENIRINQYDMDIANEVFGDEVLMLPGSFVALNSHWEDWNLPWWFHGLEVVAQVSNGTGLREIAKFDNKDLNKREEEEVRENGYALKASDHQVKSVVSRKRDSASTVVESNKATNLLSKRSDAEHPHPSSGQLPDTIPGIMSPPKDGKSHLQDGVTLPSQSSDTEMAITESGKNDPKNRYLYNELFELYKQVAVLHYTAMAKPWGTNAMTIDQQRPEAHPVFKEQFMTWRKVAKDICPPGLIGEL